MAEGYVLFKENSFTYKYAICGWQVRIVSIKQCYTYQWPYDNDTLMDQFSGHSSFEYLCPVHKIVLHNDLVVRS